VLTQAGLAETFGASLLSPVSRARDADPFAPAARYFVLHDTSGPNLRRFPGDLDSHRRINNLARFRCSDGWELAHVVINRPGEVFVGHDFAESWRATKFERATQFGTDLKGLFLHVELLQPRRGRGGTIAPTPGFTREQYDRLALVYVVASVRAGEWLIPATHAAIDNDIRNGHDDPQNFEFVEFARSLEALAARLQQAEAPVIALTPATPALDAQAKTLLPAPEALSAPMAAPDPVPASVADATAPADTATSAATPNVAAPDAPPQAAGEGVAGADNTASSGRKAE
jgi:hypothetical protein